MEENLTPEQIQELQKQLEQTKKDLELSRQNPTVVQSSSQDKLIETFLEKGAAVFIETSKTSAEVQKYTADKKGELEKEELKAINKLDTKEKLYKGTLIIVCISALILSAIFIEKAEVVIPVLSLIIGLLFKSNSLSDFFSHKKNKYPEIEEN